MYCSVPQIRPPLATLALVKSAITPSLPLSRPQLRVQKDENNAFDDFPVAIWKDVIYKSGSSM